MYLLCLSIKINTVTCPGVWLCPKGEVMLKVQALQQTNKTKRIHPKFPLNYNEKLTFQRLIIGGIETIADVLENEEIQVDLIQWMIFNSKWGAVLAKFTQHLRNIFDSFLIDESVTISSKTDLLMCRTEHFPGIISPKINATFQLQIKLHKSTERIMPPLSSSSCHQSHLLRQRKVCHSRFSYPYNGSLCSTCDAFLDYERPLTSSHISNSCNCYVDKTNPSFCSCKGCNCVDSVPCKCCCCLKYHRLFH